MNRKKHNTTAKTNIIFHFDFAERKPTDKQADGQTDRQTDLDEYKHKNTD